MLVDIGTKKIVLIGSQPPKIGGISTHIKSLKFRLRRNGFKVTVLDIFNTHENLKQTDGEILSGSNPVKLWINIFKLGRQGFEIFHFHSSRRAYAFLMAVPLVKLLNKKAVLSIHHGGFNAWLLKYKWRRFIYLGFFSPADKIIFMNPDDAEKFNEFSDIKKNRVQSIPPFIVEDEKYFKATYPVTNQKNEFLITTIGGWRIFYFFESVIDACLNLVERYKIPVKLHIIAGTSKINEAYREKIIKLADEKSGVHFCISIMENKVGILDYLVGRDVLVRSNKIDSYGISVAEALMVGTPAIATDVCPRPANAILYKPGDVCELTGILKKISDEKKTIVNKKSMITRGDDAYYKMVELYKSL